MLLYIVIVRRDFSDASALENIKSELPALGDHLAARIKSGAFCVHRPDAARPTATRTATPTATGNEAYTDPERVEARLRGTSRTSLLGG